MTHKRLLQNYSLTYMSHLAATCWLSKLVFYDKIILTKSCYLSNLFENASIHVATR